MPVRSRRCIWGIHRGKEYLVKVTGYYSIGIILGRREMSHDPRVRIPAYYWYQSFHEDLGMGTIDIVNC